MENMNIRHELKEAIDTIADLARKPLEESQEVHTTEIYGRPYYINHRSGCPVPVVLPVINTPTARDVSSLDGLIKLVRDEGVHIVVPEDDCWKPDENYPCGGDRSPRLFVEVHSYRRVTVYTDNLNFEKKHYELYATSSNTEMFCAGREYSHEEMMIALRSMFQHTPDLEYLLNLLGSVTNEAKVTSTDNGLNQQVTVNKGIANIQREPVKSIVTLKPYRTFPEVEQPESEFLVRLSTDSEGGIRVALHPADGGMWKLTAMRTIQAYLSEALSEEIDGEEVTVL